MTNSFDPHAVGESFQNIQPRRRQGCFSVEGKEFFAWYWVGVTRAPHPEEDDEFATEEVTPRFLNKRALLSYLAENA